MQWRIKIPAWWPTAIVLLGILWLTLSPKPTGEMSFRLFPHQDKVAHAVMFGALALALCRDSYKCGHALRPLTCALISISAGALIEIIQEMMHLGRSAEWADFGADAIGAFVGALIWVLWRKKQNLYD